jgi:hypothetical protein
MSNIFDNTIQTPGYDNFIRVLINDVDPVNNVVHAFDKTGVLIQALYNDQPGGALLVPAPNEIWTAVRRGYSWFLLNKLDVSGEISDLQPGSLRLQASSTVVLKGQKGLVEDNPWGATIYDRYYNPSGGFASVVLSRDAVGPSTIVPYLNGLAVMPNLWTYNSDTRTISFNSTVGEIGNLVVAYQTWGPNWDDAAVVTGKAYVSGFDEII